MPTTWVPAAVEVLCMELATVPPMILLANVLVAVVEVFILMPYKLVAPVLEFETVKPPMVLFDAVQLLLPKLNMAITSLADVLLDVYVMLPVALTLPIVLPVVFPIVVRPDETYIPLKGAALFVPSLVPDCAMAVMVLP